MSDLTPSHLSESSKVYVPNFPLILAIKAMENNPSKELLFKGLLQTTKPKEFQSRTAKEFLFGYSDSFISGISFGIENYRQEKIGIMGTRRGISTDNLTVYTGEDNLEKLLEVHAMNGESKMNIWDTDECNEIKGTGMFTKIKISCVKKNNRGEILSPFAIILKSSEVLILIRQFCSFKHHILCPKITIFHAIKFPHLNRNFV